MSEPVSMLIGSLAIIVLAFWLVQLLYRFTGRAGSGLKSDRRRKWRFLQRRPSFAAIALSLCFALSLAQYVKQGEVSWITDSFRTLETSARQLFSDGGLDYASSLASWQDIKEWFTFALSGDVQSVASLEGYKLSGRVVKVRDGDTISIVDSRDKTHEIRLHGIDTPEFRQPHANTARRALSRLVAGRTVGISIKDTDAYGRTVGVVYVDGTNVNLEMVRGCHAWWYKRYAAREFELRKAEQEARERKCGLWAAANPIAPWEWRRARR